MPLELGRCRVDGGFYAHAHQTYASILTLFLELTTASTALAFTNFSRNISLNS